MKHKLLKTKNLAVVFGTFAPMHIGHVDLITRAKRENDAALVVVSGTNTEEDRGTLKERHSDITIIDWYSVANNNQNYFEPDKVHLNSEGVETMVSLIEKSLKHPVEIK